MSDFDRARSAVGVSLHGFLGSPQEAPGYSALELITPDLNRTPWKWEKDDLSSAAARVNELSCTMGPSRLLLGYSLGARVAMHALVAAPPDRWAGAVFLSGHPGLANESERRERIASDEEWARRFEGPESWASLMDSWNAQGVFSGGSSRTQKEQSDLRPVYAAILRNGSLGRQSDLRPSLRKLKTPMLWITGERDVKFTALARSLGCGRTIQIAEAGHRVALDRPGAVNEAILKFHREITQ